MSYKKPSPVPFEAFTWWEVIDSVMEVCNYDKGRTSLC